MREVLAGGERNPVRVFAAGARAFLAGAWEERDLARLFSSVDAPPGFDAALRDRFGAWVRRGGGGTAS